MRLFLALLWVLFAIAWAQYQMDDPNQERAISKNSPCYSQSGHPQRCLPQFVNAAFGRSITVTNTCGVTSPITYCQQTDNHKLRGTCQVCDSDIEGYKHLPEYLIDFNNPDSKTWWQSETMAEGLQYPNSVNLTINLGKTYEITYVKLTFVSPRPESFAIYKKTHFDSEWIPWQYYSGSCRTTYRLPTRAPILPGNEAMAQCTNEFSDITPLTGGDIAFSTLEGRPSAANFEESEILQEWVTATDIMISLNRMNTYGDEVFRDINVLRTYYYAISDFAIGGRLKCNGHAGTGIGLSLKCECKHNTVGDDCEKCDSFSQVRPWRAATSTEANECLPCECNGLARRCFFDQTLYNKTGNGGHCLDCEGNTTGPHCETCVVNHWRRPNEKHCVPCNCNPIGSEYEQCNANGKCKCKPGITGRECDRCTNGFFDFSNAGCKDCHCNLAGAIPDNPKCSEIDGQCRCKVNVEGTRCSMCKPGTFNLDELNPRGCTNCFCYGHSSNCTSAFGYAKHQIEANFDKDTENWTAGSLVDPQIVRYDELDKAIAVSQEDNYPAYFYLPQKFLGDLRYAYNQLFSFSLHLMRGHLAGSKGVVKIVGANGKVFTFDMGSCGYIPNFDTQDQPIPESVCKIVSPKTHKVHIRLNSNDWSPNSDDTFGFLSVLQNVTEFSIRGTYAPGDVGILYNFTLQTATDLVNPNDERANWVERCTCGEEYRGQFCEECAPGYKRVTKFGGPLSECILCQCNGHSEICDPESGDCLCQHNTGGSRCDECARGFYGDPLADSLNPCQNCGCPNNGPCLLIGTEVYCTDCPLGTTGEKCQNCTDEYYMNSVSGVCEPCVCNGNLDPNEIGNCDVKTGECKKCINKTTGFNCEQCESGFWGDAKSQEPPKCRPCNCFEPGTRKPFFIEYKHLPCNQENGQCSCLPNVIGERCNRCQDGFFNIGSGRGCEPCDCNSFGSKDINCNINTGKCECKPGIVGDKCNECKANHFGFSLNGCQSCLCNKFGSEDAECDSDTGQCLCFENVEGRRCDRCMENFYDLGQKCLECNDCYKLTQTRKNEINESMGELKKNLQSMNEKPVKIDNKEFEANLSTTENVVKKLWEDSNNIKNENYQKLSDFINKTSTANANFKDTLDKLDRRISKSESATLELTNKHDQLDKSLNVALDNLKTEDALLEEAEKLRSTKKISPSDPKLDSMARESQEMSNKIVSKHLKFENLTNGIIEKLKNAAFEANETVFGQPKFAQKIYTLQRQLKDLERQFENLNESVEVYVNSSIVAYDLALNKLRDSESVNLSQWKYLNESTNYTFFEDWSAEFNHYQAEAQKQEVEAGKCLNKLKKTTDEFDQFAIKFKEARNEYKKIKRKIERAGKFKKQANDTVEKSKRIMENAEKTLRIVEKFVEDRDNVIGNFKEELENSEKVDVLVNAVNKQVSLLEIDAENSLFKHEDVKTRASFARQKAKQYRKDVDTHVINTDELRRLTSEEFKQLKNLDNDLTEYENAHPALELKKVDEEEKANELLKSAIQTSQRANQTMSQIENTAEMLKDSLAILDTFNAASDEELDLLEEKLNSLESLADNIEIEKSKDEDSIKSQRESLKTQIQWLQAEKNNLQEIYENLPTKCFNEISLEKE